MVSCSFNIHGIKNLERLEIFKRSNLDLQNLQNYMKKIYYVEYRTHNIECTLYARILITLNSYEIVGLQLQVWDRSKLTSTGIH